MTKYKILIFLVLSCPVVCRSQQRSITLEECQELSLKNNPEVRSAEINLREARAQKHEVFTNWFPQISAAAFGFHALDPLLKLGLNDVITGGENADILKYYVGELGRLTGINTTWSFMNYGYGAAVNLIQPVFAGGRIANGNALAELGVRSAGVKEEIAERDNRKNVEQKYWAVVSLTEKKEALQQALDMVRNLENDVTTAQMAGLAGESEVMQVKVKEKELETLMIRLKNGERLSKMDLFNAIGLEYKIMDLDVITLAGCFSQLDPPEKYYRDEESVAASLEESRLLQMAVDAKGLEKKMVMGEALPQISLGAYYGCSELIGDFRPNGALYATIQVPLSDWWKTSHKMQRSQYEIEKAQIQKDYLDKQLLLKTHKEWLDLESAWEQMKASEEALRLSELTEKQKKAEYDAGMCTLNELLQIQTELQNVHSNYVDSCIEYCNAICAWQK